MVARTELMQAQKACLVVGSTAGEEIGGPLLEGAVFDGAVAVVVDDGVAKDAIEPGGGGLAAAEIGDLLDSAEVGGLDDVFGGGGSFDA
jgi:hypothetical protein